MAKENDLLDALLAETENLSFGDDIARDALTKRAKMYFRNLLGEDSDYVNEIARIHFMTMYAPSTRAEDVEAWEQGRARLCNLIRTIKEERELFGHSSTPEDLDSTQPTSAFTVHGHDEELKQAVA